MYDTTAWLITGLAIAIVVFLVCRELLTWYWKLNEIVSLLKRQNELIETIAKDTGRWARTPLPPAEPPAPDDSPAPRRNPLIH